MPTVQRIHLHPLKGFPPVAVREARVLGSGALADDRRWAFMDERNRFVNGKNTPLIHMVQAAVDLDAREIAVNGHLYSLGEPEALERTISEILGLRVTLHENIDLGYPDDMESPGPTCVSHASLEAVAGWFGRDVDEMRLRFRANIEWDGVAPFWEDRLYGRPFAIGGTRWLAVNPCQRCVVPSRHPATGEVIDGFQRRFAEHRQRTLPADTDVDCFSHYYRFAVNTRLEDSGDGVIRVGDTVRE